MLEERNGAGTALEERKGGRPPNLPRGKPLIDIERLPPRHGVRPDNRVVGNQLLAHVQRMTTLEIVSDLDPEATRFVVEELGVVLCRQGLEVGDKGGGHAF